MDKNTRTQLATGILLACTLTGVANVLSKGDIKLANKPAIVTENDDSKNKGKPSLTDSDGTITTSDSTDIDKDGYLDNREDFTKDEFIKRLCKATGAKDIEIEDASSYYTSTSKGANDSYKIVYYKVDGKTIYVTGYNNTNGNKVYFGNDNDKYYITDGSNLVFTVGDEVTIESSKQLSHDEFFGLLKGYPEFVENFSSQNNYDSDVELMKSDNEKMYTRKRVYNGDFKVFSEKDSYAVDGNLWYAVDYNVNGDKKEVYYTDGLYSDHNAKQYSK